MNVEFDVRTSEQAAGVVSSGPVVVAKTGRGCGVRDVGFRRPRISRFGG